MKNILILSLLAFGWVGCETYNRVPYTGGVGEYGFTYDLDSSPSPFSDTSYRPLSPYELAAPIIVVVTNQPPERYQIDGRAPTDPRNFGQTPAGTTSVATSPVIIESAGSPANPDQVGAEPAPTRAAAPSYVEGSENVILPSDDINISGSNTNIAATNITATNITNYTNITNTNAFTSVTNTNNLGGITNTNAFTSVPNTNNVGGITNTNAFAGGTNRVINEAAGTQLQTNQQPATPFQTNRINEPAGTPQINGTQTPPGSQPSSVRPPPAQRPSDPPASEPQNPPTPVTP